MSIEQSLVDRCLKRASNYGGTVYTQWSLAERCSSDVSENGPQARTSILMKGNKGSGLKKHRRIIPSGPLGRIIYAYPDGLLSIEFPSAGLLAALRNQFSVFSALAGYYTSSCENPYPRQMSVELAVQFSHEHIGIEIDQDVVETLMLNDPPEPFGNSHILIPHLLEIEHTALRRRWKRLDLAKWTSAGLKWPLVRAPRTGPSQPKPDGVKLKRSTTGVIQLG